jgi:hypothetical protein
MTMTMTTPYDAISRQTELLSALTLLSDAPDALAHLTVELRELKRAITGAEWRLSALRKTEEVEREVHVKLQKSVWRRSASRLVGHGEKFAVKVDKEKR